MIKIHQHYIKASCMTDAVRNVFVFKWMCDNLVMAVFIVDDCLC